MFAAETEVARKAAGANLKRGAKREFDRRSPAVTAAARSAFQTQTGPRYEALAQSNVDKGVDAGINAGSDVSKSDTDRLEAMAASRQVIEDGNRLLGPLSSAKSEVRLLTGLASGTLLGLLRTSADPDALVSDFIDGKSTDVILAGILPQLTQEQQQTIGQKAQDAAGKQIEVGIARRKSASVAAAAENTASFQRMIGLDFTDPDLRSVAQTEHERLKRIGYYEKPAAIAAVDKLFDLEAGESVKFVATAESIALQNDLQGAEYLNRLNYEDVLAAEGKIPPEFYRQMLTALQTERTQAKNVGIQVFKDVFGYTAKEDESGELAAPAKAAFLFNSRTLSSWVDEHPTAPYYEVIGEAERLVVESREKFQSEMLKFQRNNLNQILSTTAGAIGVDVLSDDVSMQVIIEALNLKIRAIAADGSKKRLRATLFRARTEAQRSTGLRVFDR